MTVAPAQIPAPHASAAAPVSAEFQSVPMVGNPRRTRGLSTDLLRRPAPVSTMVGNPRRTRRLDPAVLSAA